MKSIAGYPQLGGQLQQLIPMNKFLRVVDAWDYLNDVCFKGEMARPKIVVWAELHGFENGKKIPLDGAYSIETSKIWLRHGSRHLLESLYHEMCHQFIGEILGDKYQKHGELFNEVYVKGIELLEKKLNVG